ncbi:MAG: hypothetical protein ABEJ25_02025 [Candidatus Bipolaricaulia bacterium]
MKNNLMIKPLATLLCLLLLISGLTCLTFGESNDLKEVSLEKDLIRLALTKLDLTKEALKVKFPPGYMSSRAPLPQQVPYKLDFFPDLYKEPRMVYPFSKVMEKAVSKLLKPGYKEKNMLYKLLFYLGIDKLNPGLFRGYYGDELKPPELPEEEPILTAYDRLLNVKNRSWVLNNYSYTNPKKRAESEIEKLPKKLRGPVGRYLIYLKHALNWHLKGVRNVKYEDLNKVYQIRDFGRSHQSAQKFHPAIEDVEKSLDKSAIFTASQQVSLATMVFSDEIKKLSTEMGEFGTVSIPTPIGRVVISDSQDSSHKYSDALLIVDLGGDDQYQGLVGANPSPHIPISVCIDLSGDDSYKNSNKKLATQGTGILGTGILMDLGGNDSYNSYSYSQGMGFFGTGILYDEEGDDSYSSIYSSQGTGYFGIGLNLDKTGDDEFYLGGMGQGYGGPGGIGVLANYSGNDRYEAERYPSEKVKLADYHADNLINGNMAQGVGGGRRGDLTDGEAWAGGLGVIMDIKGDDKYKSGNWSLGAGYWFGTGICFDKHGNDTYNSVYFTQGSEAHWALGALIDETGDDHHNLFDRRLYFKEGETSVKGGAGLGFGWDGGTGIVINREGNDTYKSQRTSFGLADIRSHAYFFDEGGNDYYLYGKGKTGFGASDSRESYTKPTLGSTYNLNKYSNNLGMFIDSGGNDKYQEWNFREKFESSTKSSRFTENSYWLTPCLEDAKKGNNFGIGLDTEGGIIKVHEFWEEW